MAENTKTNTFPGGAMFACLWFAVCGSWFAGS